MFQIITTMIIIDLRFPISKLSKLLDQALDDAFGNDFFEVHGIKMKIRRTGSSRLKFENKSISVQVNSAVKLIKGSGLFSAEVNGSITLDLSIDYDIDQLWNVSSITELQGYNWNEKPKLEIGFLKLPIETITDMAIDHYKGIITAKIDDFLQNKIDIKEYVSSSLLRIYNKVEENVYYDHSPSLVVRDVQLLKPVAQDRNLFVRAGLVVSIHFDQLCHDNSVLPMLNWCTKLDQNNISLAQIEITESLILALIKEQLQDREIGGKPLILEQEAICIKDGTVIFTALMSSPIQAGVEIKLGLNYNEHLQALELLDNDVQIKPSSILYKLSTPIVNRFVEGFIDDLFPIMITEKLKDFYEEFNGKELMLENGMKASGNIEKVVISKLALNANVVSGVVKLMNSSISLVQA